MTSTTRRNFFKTAGIFTAFSYNRILGANDRINVGFIGTGKMGMGNLLACHSLPNTDISWVCDVWERNLLAAKREAPHAKTTKDFRRVLEDDPDTVCISTPDHWHALMVVEAAKHGIVFQSGQWQRSGNQFLEAIASVHAGVPGKIKSVKTWLHWQEGNMGKPLDCPPPKDLGKKGWNMWLGPAPYHAFNWNRFASNPQLDPEHKSFSWFRNFWDYANGMLGDWGPHTIDIAQWGMKGNMPLLIQPAGSRGCTDDNRETPAVLNIVYDFGHFKLEFDFNGCKLSEEGKKRNWGIEWCGEYGSVFVDREVCQFKDTKDNIVREVKSDKQAHLNHWKDFLSAISNDHTETRGRPGQSRQN